MRYTEIDKRVSRRLRAATRRERMKRVLRRALLENIGRVIAWGVITIVLIALLYLAIGHQSPDRTYAEYVRRHRVIEAPAISVEAKAGKKLAIRLRYNNRSNVYLRIKNTSGASIYEDRWNYKSGDDAFFEVILPTDALGMHRALVDVHALSGIERYHFEARVFVSQDDVYVVSEGDAYEDHR